MLAPTSLQDQLTNLLVLVRIQIILREDATNIYVGIGVSRYMSDIDSRLPLYFAI